LNIPEEQIDQLAGLSELSDIHPIAKPLTGFAHSQEEKISAKK
jgi:hypothetical protein